MNDHSLKSESARQSQPAIPSAAALSSVAPLQLVYAPPARSQKMPFIVLACGGASTLLALVGVYLAHQAGENIMGWYGNYVIPAGAILVGLVSAAGYGIASWFTGVKVRSYLLLTILVIQLFAYVAAQYLEFRLTGPYLVPVSVVRLPGGGQRVSSRSIGFPEYYHLRAVNFAWKSRTGDKPGEPLGGWGYFFRLLEVLGFVGGSLVVPALLMKAPYCELCQVYMKTRHFARLAASGPARDLATPPTASAGQPPPTAAQQSAQYLRAAADEAADLLAALRKSVESGDVPAFANIVAQLIPSMKDKSIEKLPQRIHLKIIYCRNCNTGTLRVFTVTGKGDKAQSALLTEFDLPRDFVLQTLTLLARR